MRQGRARGRFVRELIDDAFFRADLARIAKEYKRGQASA
jgi:hypothetical protein